jgi:GGDEF domain-containing protein
MGWSDKEADRLTAQEESSADRLRRVTTPSAVSVELVSAFAGDRRLTEAERALIRAHRDGRGEVFFSDLLYAVTHQYFAPKIAEALWNKVLVHKHMMSEKLGRNVRIAVATLDYLSNMTGDFPSPTLISEAYVSEIANHSMRDGMTGLYNHSTCYELLELEFRGHLRYGAGVSVILLDIDDFKLVNDRYGHQEGDRILIELARTLEEQVRDSDICCRKESERGPRPLPVVENGSPSARELPCAIMQHSHHGICWKMRTGRCIARRERGRTRSGSTHGSSSQRGLSAWLSPPGSARERTCACHDPRRATRGRLACSHRHAQQRCFRWSEVGPRLTATLAWTP